MSEHFGIYALTGSVMTTVNQESSVAEDLTTNTTGGVTLVYPSATGLRTFGNEVVSLNAFYSGSEAIEHRLFGTSSLAVAWQDRYLSKQSGNTFRYLSYVRAADIDDVFHNPPDTAPSGSKEVAQSLGYSETWAEIGSLLEPVPSGTAEIQNVKITLYNTGSTYLNAALYALSGNIVKITAGTSSFTAVVNNPSVVGATSSVRFTIPMAGYSSRSFTYTSGTVKVFSLVPLSSSVSGVFFNNTYYSPASVPVEVLDEGQIRDVRVWVELAHDTRNRSDVIASGSGLQATQLALRSPNTSFKAAHPVWNSPAAAAGLPLRSSGSMSSQYYDVPGLLQNSYLLWAGHGVEDGLDDSINPSGSYHEYDLDIDMRTVFWDGSQVRNPRDLAILFPSASNLSPGTPRTWAYLLTGSRYPSPTNQAFDQGITAVGAPPAKSLGGHVIPWMAEPSLVPQGAFGTGSVTGTGVPPAGWAVPEAPFQPTGSNFGPETIRPVYPLLDDVHVFKAVDAVPAVSGAFSLPNNHGEIRGSRPGLRGTGINGTWHVLVGGAASSYNDGYAALSSSGVWLRQVRLEFIVDSHTRLFEFTPSRARKWLKPTIVPGPDGYQNVGVVSGAAAWDVGVSLVQHEQSPDYGRTVSISADQAVTSYAVISRITGSLRDRLASEGITDPSWFLNGNGFGTPYIPDSSMSLGNVPPEAIDAEASAEMYRRTIGQSTLIPNANTMTDFLNREGYSRTTEQIWTDVLASGSQ